MVVEHCLQHTRRVPTRNPDPVSLKERPSMSKIDLSQAFHEPSYRETVHWINPFGVDCGAYTSASLPVFLRPLCQLKSNAVLGFSCSLHSESLTNLKIVFVGKRVVNRFHSRYSCQNLLAHFVHSVLNACTVICGKCIKGDFPCSIPCFIEIRN